MIRPLCVVTTLLLLTLSPATAQERGALALDERGERYALSLDGEADALSTCGTTECEIVATFSACLGVAHSSPTLGEGVWAWAEALARPEARRDALNQCRGAGGEACEVFADVCVDAAAAEAALGLDRAARRQLQERLQAAGFDPGGADGLFGPRTRAAIRQWQESRAAPATGYLNRPAVETLGNPDRSAPLSAPTGYRTVTPATPAALAEASPTPAAASETGPLTSPTEVASPAPTRPPAAAPAAAAQQAETAQLGLAPAHPQQIPDGRLPLDTLVQLDRSFLRIERLLETGDNAAAFLTIEQIVELYDSHAVQVPPKVDYRYAQIAAQAGSFQAARDAVDRYIAATGRNGVHYRDVLELLDLIELNEQNLVVCTTASYSHPCWRAQAEQSQCAIWDPSYLPNHSVVWSGPCIFGKAHGQGTLSWRRNGDDFRSDTGLLQNGHKQGDWIERRTSGNVEAGPYVDGIRQGRWILTTADGSDNDGRIMQGRYVNGARYGSWDISWPEGETLRATYDNGVLSGPSIRRFPNGTWEEGQYANGEKEGEWKRFNSRSDLLKTETFVAGVLYGPWRSRTRRDYCESFGSYVDGQREGEWTECLGTGTPFWGAGANDILWSGAYVAGKREGRWTGTLHENARHSEGAGYVRSTFVHYGRIEGVFNSGSAVVTAIQERNSAMRLGRCRVASKTPYVDGTTHGTRWRVRSLDCQCLQETWIDGRKVKEESVRRGDCNREIF